MKNEGWTWHCHHDILLEWCWDYNERIEYIKVFKSANEVSRRLQLFQFVKSDLPTEIEKGWQNYKKAQQDDKKAWQDCEIAWQNFTTAHQAYNKAHQSDEATWQYYKLAQQDYEKARQYWIKARQAYNKAWQDSLKIFDTHKDYLKQLHAKECGCKEWNEKKLIFLK